MVVYFIRAVRSVCIVLEICCRVSSRLFFFQAEDGIRDLVRSRGLGDVYKRQNLSAAYMRAREWDKALTHADIAVDLVAVPSKTSELSLIHI